MEIYSEANLCGKCISGLLLSFYYTKAYSLRMYTWCFQRSVHLLTLCHRGQKYGSEALQHSHDEQRLENGLE